jgi:putative AlgH/UPF0301 family transcriptional regulator
MDAPASPDPESGPPTRPATGQRRAAAVPLLSIGGLADVVPGALLVAMPSLTDPTFAGTVIYVIDHSAGGTVGVVLGRPSQVAIRDVLPGWSDLAVEPGVFHVGGPCETDTALCLGTTADRSVPGLRPVAGEVHLVDLDGDPDDVAGHLSGLRVFAGYAGWSGGQLATEIAEGAWACVPGHAADVLSTVSGPELWRQVLGRQRGRLGVLSTAPADPSVN